MNIPAAEELAFSVVNDPKSDPLPFGAAQSLGYLFDLYSLNLSPNPEQREKMIVVDEKIGKNLIYRIYDHKEFRKKSFIQLIQLYRQKGEDLNGAFDLAYQSFFGPQQYDLSNYKNNPLKNRGEEILLFECLGAIKSYNFKATIDEKESILERLGQKLSSINPR